MDIVATDHVISVAPGTDPDYESRNPLMRLIGVFESIRLAAEREHYQQDLLQGLMPIASLTLYGPREPNHQKLDPKIQDFIDFQKQNVQDFALEDTYIVRGWVTVDDWTGPFLRISYRGAQIPGFRAPRGTRSAPRSACT